MRVKRGPHSHLRHKKVLKITKGQRGSKHLLFRRANEAMLKSLWYATRDRRVRKRDPQIVDRPHQRRARSNGTTYRAGCRDEKATLISSQDAGRHRGTQSAGIRGWQNAIFVGRMIRPYII
jgi:ribosomal protein L20